jgi:low temperature requirement protein LtrA
MAVQDDPANTDGSEDDQYEGNLELFFDLVFVFAMSQVTHLMLSDVSWLGLGRGVLSLLAVWWSWVGYTWLTNTFRTTEVSHRILMIAAMAAMLVAAATLPSAFGSGALVFGLALFVVRLIHAGEVSVLVLAQRRGTASRNPPHDNRIRRSTRIHRRRSLRRFALPRADVDRRSVH